MRAKASPHLFTQPQSTLPLRFFDTLSADGTWRASGTQNKIIISNCETQKIIYQLDGHADNIACVAISSDGKYIVSAGMDNIIKLWDCETQRCLHTFNSDTSYVSHITFSPDGKWVLSGNNDFSSEKLQIEVWNTETAQQVFLTNSRFVSKSSDPDYCEIGPAIECIAISADGKQVDAGSKEDVEKNAGDKTIIGIWPKGTSIGLHNAGSFNKAGENVFHQPGDWSIMIVGSSLKIWDIKNGYCLRTLESNLSLIQKVLIHPNGKQIISVATGNRDINADTTLHVWNVATGSCLQTLTMSKSIHSILFNSNGSRLFTASFGGIIRIWDCSTWTVLNAFQTTNRRFAPTMIFSTDEKQLFLMPSSARQFCVLDCETGKLLHDFTIPMFKALPDPFSPFFKLQMSTVTCNAINSNQSLFAFGLVDYIIRILDINTLSWKTLRGHTGNIKQIVYSDDNTKIVSFSSHGSLRVWNIASERCIFAAEPKERAVNHLQFSANDQWIILTSLSGNLEILDSNNGQCLHHQHIASGIKKMTVSNDLILIESPDKSTHELTLSLLVAKGSTSASACNV